MINVRKRSVTITCDCPGCPTKRIEAAPLEPTAAELARIRGDAEVNGGWFVEIVPGKGPREFCPKHADAYRTMLAALLDTIPRTGRAGAGDRRRAS